MQSRNIEQSAYVVAWVAIVSLGWFLLFLSYRLFTLMF